MARSLSQLFYALGGSVNPGKSNDELIDHLIDAEFIRTPAIQRVFRSVDRGDYYHPNHRQNAYKDIAWRMGNLHLSAPCVYSVVMETLKLRPGLSFLNLGSGSGYLSTMAGLLLGQYGINHGIEFHEDIVEYAYERLDEFLKNSKVVDEHDFCEPVFTCGNCLTLDGNAQQYDRVYCGASCPEEYEAYIKNLVKINGILIMPLNDKLLKITRVNETVWTTVKVLSVSFAPLILPPPAKKGEAIEHAKLGDLSPPTLQQLCRFAIRTHLRSIIESEQPTLKTTIKHQPAPRNNLRLFVIDCGDDGESDEDRDTFTLMMRSMYQTNRLWQSFAQGLDHSEGSEEDVDEDEGDEVMDFTRFTTIRDAVEDAGDKNLRQGQAKQVVDSLSEIEKVKREAERTDDDVPAKIKKGDVETVGSSHKAGAKRESKRAKNMSKTRSNSTRIGKKLTIKQKSSDRDSNKGKNRLDASGNKNASSSLCTDLSLPPSQSTRSRTNVLKRKQDSLDDGPSTSAGCSSSAPKKKMAEKAAPKKAWYKRTNLRSSKKTSNLTVDLDKKVLKENSHTYHLTQRIAALPLPAFLRNYINYKRDNIISLPSL